MGAMLWRGLAGFVTFSRWVVAAPVMVIMLVVYLAIATLLGLFGALIFAGIVEWIVGPMSTGMEWLAGLPALLISWTLAVTLWAERTGVNLLFRRTPEGTHGTARFARKAERADLQGHGDGLIIGRDGETGRLLRWSGPAHLLTLAPTRSGKGVGTVIPNLLAVPRAMLVIDPKGENARIAGDRRAEFGPVHVLDPFGVTGHPSASYNPLDRLEADSLDLGEDAATLAAALVMNPPGQVQEAHWNEEARALIAGLILFCACHEEPKRRNLATVREYLSLPADKLRALLELMQETGAAHGLIARAANRFLGKADREAASVLSNAQRHTHFLDSPRIAQSLARSDFHFADLRYEPATVFLVLPPNRLDAYARWLRLLVSQALQDIARDAEGAVLRSGIDPALETRAERPCGALQAAADTGTAKQAQTPLRRPQERPQAPWEPRALPRPSHRLCGPRSGSRSPACSCSTSSPRLAASRPWSAPWD